MTIGRRYYTHAPLRFCLGFQKWGYCHGFKYRNLLLRRTLIPIVLSSTHPLAPPRTFDYLSSHTTFLEFRMNGDSSVPDEAELGCSEPGEVTGAQNPTDNLQARGFPFRKSSSDPSLSAHITSLCPVSVNSPKSLPAPISTLVPTSPRGLHTSPQSLSPTGDSSSAEPLGSTSHLHSTTPTLRSSEQHQDRLFSEARRAEEDLVSPHPLFHDCRNKLEMSWPFDGNGIPKQGEFERLENSSIEDLLQPSSIPFGSVSEMHTPLRKGVLLISNVSFSCYLNQSDCCFAQCMLVILMVYRFHTP